MIPDYEVYIFIFFAFYGMVSFVVSINKYICDLFKTNKCNTSVVSYELSCSSNNLNNVSNVNKHKRKRK